MLYEHYLALATELSDLVARIDAQGDPSTRDQLVELLQRVDLLHREGLLRLVDALRAGGAGEALDRAADDPIVRILLGLYGLVDLGLERRERTSQAFVPLAQVTVRRKPAAAERPLPEDR
jgi:hypothetical protein